MKARLTPLFALLSLIFLVACGGGSEESVTPSNGSKGSLALVADKKLIRSNGEDAIQLTILYTNAVGATRELSEEEAELFCEGKSEPLAENRFSTTTAGEYKLYAVYNEVVSNVVKVNAVDGIPEVPADSAPENLSFRHRIMLLQHTGTGCPNCPRMMNILKVLSEDEHYAPLYLHVGSHSFNDDDPAYTSAAVTLSRTLNPLGYYPWLSFNLTEEYAHESSVIESRIDELHRESAEVGITAAASLVNGTIYVNAAVKSAVTRNYRIAIWILEDNISGKQDGATASWHSIHSNCLREMYGENKTSRIYGTSVGEVPTGQQSAEYIAAIKTQGKWNLENCKVMVIVSGLNESNTLDLLNCAICPIGGSIGYEYN